MSRTASQWMPNVAAPDLSNVLRMAGRTGANQGYNEFMAQVLKEQKAEAAAARKDEEDEREAAADDLSNEPESEGFWQKLGQTAMEGLERTVDVISRFNYGSANFFKSIEDDTQGNDDESLLSQFKDEVKAIPKATKEALDGFTGKDKTTFAQVYAQHAKNDGKSNFLDSKWTQGLMGFTSDVALDPTTYIGLGLISKPLKAGTKAAEDNVGKHARDLWDFSKDAAKLELKVDSDVPLSAIDIYRSLGGPELAKQGHKGRAYKLQSARVKGTRYQIENYEKIQKAIRESVGAKAAPDVIKKYDAEIERLRGDYSKALNDYGQRAYKSAIKRYATLHADDIPPAAGNADEFVERVTQRFEDTLDTLRVAKAISTVNWKSMKIRPTKAVKATRNKRGDIVAGGAGASSKAAFKAEQQKMFDEALGDAWRSDPRISDEFRQTAWETIERLAATNPTYRSILDGRIYGAGGIKARITNLKRRINEEKDPATLNALRSQLIKEEGSRDAGIKGALAYAWQDANAVKANMFIKMLGAHVGDPRFLSPVGEEFNELMVRRSEILANLRGKDAGDISSAPKTSHETGPQRVKGDKRDGDIMSESRLDSEAGLSNGELLDETASLKRELKDIDNRMSELLASDDFIKAGDELPLPAGAPTDVREIITVNKNGTVDLAVSPDASPEVKAWAVEVLKAVEVRSSVLVDREIRTLTRRAREARANERTTVLDNAFGGPKKDKPQITLPDGTVVVKGVGIVTPEGKAISSSAKAKEALSRHVTDADRNAYRKQATEASNEVVDKGAVTAKLDGSEATVGQAAAKADVTKTGFAAQPQEWHAFDRLFEEQHGIRVGAAINARKTGQADIEMPKDWKPTISKAKKVEIQREATEKAILSVNEDISDGSLKVIANKSVDLRGAHLGDDVPEHVDDITEAHSAAVRQTKEEYARKIAATKVANPRANSNPAKIKTKAEELIKARDAEIKALSKAHDEAIKTAEAMEKRMREQVTLNMLNEAIMSGKTYMRVTGAGVKIMDIPVPVIFTKATEKIGGLPILQSAHKAWSQAFHPASKLEPELNLARLRAQARTPDIIKHHVDDIRNKFAHYKPAQRKAALQGIIKGSPVEGELNREMSQFFEDFLPYVQNKVLIDDAPLEIRELNHFLPEQFQLIHPNKGNVNALSITSPKSLLSHMRNLNADTDPMQVMWRLKIASEQALANKAMKSTIKQNFGVKRVLHPGDAKVAPQSTAEELIEDLHKTHGWVTVRSIGDDYYFPPEMAAQIERLDEIIKPAKIHEVTRLFDKVLRAWKSTVTVYNPGYYTRNGIGETIMGLMDGVDNPVFYARAGKILKSSDPDSVKEALKTLEPWKRHETTRQAMARKATNRKFMVNGKMQQLTNEDVWVLYHEVGLKSGFISTEFDHYFPTAGSMKATPVGQVATKINDAVRHGGEKYEDYFRLAHFISRLERSGFKSAKEAAEDAANYVRKFHYDYTDFTPFEKSVMMRIFPFYKWTRKSLPLMGSLLFTRPGLVSLYPKGMQNLSYATGGTDPLNDDNGFYPNYEDVTPIWMQNLMAYPIGRDEEDAMTYMNIATPQFDIYKMMQNPVSATLGMLNPMFKVPVEQGIGQTLDPDFKMPLDSADSRISHLMRTTPAGSLTNNVLRGQQEGEDSALIERSGRLDERLTSFITGLGFYENNKKRQQGEQFRRATEGK